MEEIKKGEVKKGYEAAGKETPATEQSEVQTEEKSEKGE